MKVQLYSQIVEKNGKTIRENNMEIPHNIPIGTLVEVKFDNWFGDGACSIIHARLWVHSHVRDCDGTPLYTLSETKDPELEWRSIGVKEELIKFLVKLHRGFVEENLKIVEVTDELKRGVGQLSWGQS